MPPRAWELRQVGLPGKSRFLGSAPAQSRGVARLVVTGHGFHVLGSRAGLGLIHSWRTHTHTHTHTHTPDRPSPVKGLLAQGDG